jgi:glycosyltransferase involved in cell wall biosynthesis
MPVRGRAPWLDEAIESVRRQQFREWELPIVDDGADEQSRAVIARHAALESGRIRPLSAPGGSGAGRGAAAARNRGIEHARGPYLAFLDADDLFLPGKLAEETPRLEAAPDAAMLYGPALWRWQDGRRADRVDRIAVEVGRVHAPPDLVRRVLVERDGDVPCTCGVLIRRERVAAAGGFEEDFRLYEDQTLWAKLFLRFGILPSPTVQSIYRQHDGSTSAEAVRQGLYDTWRPHSARRAFLDWLEDEAVRAGNGDRRLMRALRLARFAQRRRTVGRALALARRLRGRVNASR